MRIFSIILLVTLLASCSNTNYKGPESFVKFFRDPLNGYVQNGNTSSISYQAELRTRELVAFYDLGEQYYQMNQSEIDSHALNYANVFEFLVTGILDTNQIKINMNDATQLMSLQSELESHSQIEIDDKRMPIASCTLLPMGKSLQIIFGSGDVDELIGTKPTLIVSSKTLGIAAHRIPFTSIKQAPYLKSAL